MLSFDLSKLAIIAFISIRFENFTFSKKVIKF